MRRLGGCAVVAVVKCQGAGRRTSVVDNFAEDQPVPTFVVQVPDHTVVPARPGYRDSAIIVMVEVQSDICVNPSHDEKGCNEEGVNVHF